MTRYLIFTVEADAIAFNQMLTGELCDSPGTTSYGEIVAHPSGTKWAIGILEVALDFLDPAQIASLTDLDEGWFVSEDITK